MLVQTLLSDLKTIDEVGRFAAAYLAGYGFSASYPRGHGAHDVVLSRPSGSTVFEFTATCSGRIVGASIWDRHPVASDLASLDFGLSEEPGVGTCRFGGHEALSVR